MNIIMAKSVNVLCNSSVLIITATKRMAKTCSTAKVNSAKCNTFSNPPKFAAIPYIHESWSYRGKGGASHSALVRLPFLNLGAVT